VNSSPLLLIDAIINLALRVLLVVFPDSLVAALGIPGAIVGFYPSIFGAVLIGTGISLIIERIRGER